MSALPVFQQKIVLIGDSLSGKSSILDRYIHNSFSKTPEPTWSMRLGTKSWAISDPAACIVNVELWDTQRGGILRTKYVCIALRMLWQFGNSPAGELFWRGTRAVVVCVDGQSPNAESVASRWLSGPAIAECRQYEPNAIVCLLATKADSFSETRAEAIEAEMQDFVTHNLCSTWAQVSAKNMTGIYDKSDFLKQLLHALVSQDLKAHKSRARRSLIKPKGSDASPTATGAGRASVLSAQLKTVPIRGTN